MPVWEMLGKDNILRDFQRLLHDSDSQMKLFMNMQYKSWSGLKY